MTGPLGRGMRYDGRLTATRMLLDQPNFTPQKLDEGCEIVACQTRRRHGSDIGYLNDTGIAGNAFYRRRTHPLNAFLIAIRDSGNTLRGDRSPGRRLA